MIISATLSKPIKKNANLLDKPYIRVKIKLTSLSSKILSYYAEFFTETQAFHKTFSADALEEFISKNVGVTFKNCVTRTENEEITLMANNKGELHEIRKTIKTPEPIEKPKLSENTLGGIFANRTKNYIIPEGTPVPFLISLGVMTDKGRIIASKYDKFKQINRFLEYINDILPSVLKAIENENGGKMRPVRIADFGCGKSYLTFAVQYFLTNIKKLPCEITGLDLKADVIDYCNELAKEFHANNLVFKIGNIANYGYETSPDIVITLHACDTATDFALSYAVKTNTKAILSVPCCQHEINTQLSENKDIEYPKEFEPLLKYGLIRERFASLATDAIRAECLEKAGYNVQILEFVDMTHTPKNLLIRAVKKSDKTTKNNAGSKALCKVLGVTPTFINLCDKFKDE